MNLNIRMYKLNPFVRIILGSKSCIISTYASTFEIEINKDSYALLKKLSTEGYISLGASIKNSLLDFLIEEDIIFNEGNAFKQISYLNNYLNYSLMTDNDYLFREKIKNRIPIESSQQGEIKIKTLPAKFRYLGKRKSSTKQSSNKKINITNIFNVIYGNIKSVSDEYTHKTVASAGGLYPIRLYYFDFKKEILVNNLGNVVIINSKELLLKIKNNLGKIKQKDWNGLIVVGFDPKNTFAKYGNRSYVFTLIEAGAILQNLTHYAIVEGLDILNVGSIQLDTMAMITGSEILPLTGILI